MGERLLASAIFVTRVPPYVSRCGASAQRVAGQPLAIRATMGALAGLQFVRGLSVSLGTRQAERPPIASHP